MQVRCPHCSNPVEIIDESSFRELSCESCGSGFSLVPDDTVSLKPQEARTLGHFELTEKIGVGAFGTVWKARDTELERTVAVKIPRKEQLSENDVEQFLREARAAAQLKHPSIVGVHEVGRDDGVVFIVSDFIDGLTLADWLTGYQPPVRVAVELVAKVAEALQAAHDKGVIHRDLKPSNIMLDDNNEPHVMDFGLAKREGAEITMTIDGQILGTPAYMAPEQARGDAHTSDARADIYSLGVVLFELLTGELPFRGNARMLLHQVIKEEAPSPRKLNSTVPRDLETITLRCLEKEPANRFQTAGELSADLTRFLNHEPVLSRPIGAFERGKRWCKRNPVVSSLATSIGILLVLGITAVSALWLRAKSNADEAIEFSAKYQEEADKAKSLAKGESAARKAAELSLVDLYTTSGLSGNAAQASLWFANALEKAEGFPSRQLANRIRFASWKKSLHAPVAALDLEGKRVKQVYWHPSLPVLLIEILDGDCQLWDLRVASPTRLVGARSGCWRPDGGGLALGTERGSAAIFNYPGGELVDRIEHQTPITAVRYSPDGAYLAIGGQETRLWSTRQHRFAGEAFRHPNPLVELGFSRNSKRMVTTCTSKEARVFSVGEAKLEPLFAPLPHEPVGYGHPANGNRNSHPFLPIFVNEDRHVLTVPERTTLVWHDATSGEKVREFEITEQDYLPQTTPKGFPVRVRSVVSSPDASQLAVTTTYSNLLLDAATAENARLLAPHAHSTRHAAFSHDGKVAATASRSVRFWQTSDGSPVERGEIFHQDFITVLSFSPRNDFLATVQYNGLIRVWATPTENANAVRLPIRGGEYSMATFSADGRFLIPTGVNNRLGAMTETVVFTTADGQPAGIKLAPGGMILDAAFSPSGDRVATICSDAETSNSRSAWPAVAELDGRLDIWDWRLGQRQVETVSFDSEPRCVDFSADGTRVAVVCAKGEVFVLDPKTGAIVHQMEMGGSRNAANFKQNGVLRFSPDGNTLVGWGFRGTKIWNADTGKLNHTLKCSPADIDFSRDGQFLATGGWDRTARVWDLRTGSQVGDPIEHPGWVHNVQFSLDGKQLLTAGRDHMARLWDWRAQRLICPAFQHKDEVMDARFVPGTSWIITASHDATARVWDPQTGKPITPPWPLGGMGWSMEVTSDGRFAVVGGQTNGIVRFDLSDLHQPVEIPVQEIRAWAELVAGKEVLRGGGVTNLTQSDWLARWPSVQDSESDSLSGGELASLKSTAGLGAVTNIGESYGALFGWLEDVRKANEYIQQGKLPEAVSAYQDIVAAHAEDEQAWYTLAMLLGFQGKWIASAEAAERAVEFAPQNAQCHRVLIRALGRQKKYDSAIDVAVKLMKLSDAEVDDWYTYALLLRATGDDAGYRKCCTAVAGRLADVSDPAEANTLVWICCLGPKPLADIEPVLQRGEVLVNSEPRSHGQLNTLGAILLRAGKAAEAHERLSEAIEVHEQDGTGWDHLFLAMAAQRSGQQSEYQTWLQKVRDWGTANLAKMVSADPLDGWRTQLEFEILTNEAGQLEGTVDE